MIAREAAAAWRRARALKDSREHGVILGNSGLRVING
jgi:hypothetical protein